jgi:hypothetical protein
MTDIKPRTQYVDAVIRAVYDLMNSGPNWDGRIGDVERAVWAALDAAVAAERERCAALCEGVREVADHAARDGHRKAGAMASAALCAKLIRA